MKKSRISHWSERDEKAKWLRDCLWLCQACKRGFTCRPMKRSFRQEAQLPTSRHLLSPPIWPRWHTHIQARSSHVACVAHAPPLRGLFFFFGWRVSWLRMPRIQKHRWRKTSLLACCLRLVYWLKVDSKSRHFVKKRPAVSIDIELERLRSTSTQGSGARSAPRGRVTECGAAVRRCNTIMCCACLEKMAPSRWTFRSNKKLKKEQDGGKRSSLLFSTNFSSRILAHLLESVCLPLVAEETFAQLVG